MKHAGRQWLLFSLFLLLSACIAEDEDLLNSDWAIFYGMGSRPLALGQQYNVNKTVVSFDSILISSEKLVFLPAPDGEYPPGSKVNIRLNPGSKNQPASIICHLHLRADLNGDGLVETPIDLEWLANDALRQLVKRKFQPTEKPSTPEVEVDLLRLLSGIDWQLAADDRLPYRRAVQRQLEKNFSEAISWRNDG